MQYAAKQPSGLYVLCLGELFERLSYYGTQAILVLYLTKIFLFSDKASYSLYGAYTTFAFALPVLGGILADRLIGLHRAIIFGSVMLIIGNLLMVSPHFDIFCLGLGVSVCGTGLFKGNSTGLVGLLYQAEDTRRNNGFTLFYIGMNIGATAGAFIYGLCTSLFGWHYGFLFSALAITCSLVIYLKNRSIKEKIAAYSHNKNRHLMTASLLFFGCLVTVFFFLHPASLGNVLIPFTVAILGVLIFSSFKYDRANSHKIFVLLVMFFFAMLFFASSLQVSSLVAFFINRDINRTIFHWEIPTVLFSALYPLAVIILAPLVTVFWNRLARKNKEPSTPSKICLGLFFAFLGFVCLTISAHPYYIETKSHMPLLWVTLANLCFGAGELIIFPSLLNSISQLAPRKFQGTMMGVCYLFVACGGYLSGVIAKLSSHTKIDISKVSTLASAYVYRHTFEIIALSAAIETIILLTLVPLLIKNTAHKKSPV